MFKNINKLLDNPYISDNINKDGLNLNFENLIAMNYNSNLATDLIVEYKKVIKFIEENAYKKSIYKMKKYSTLEKSLNRLFANKFKKIISKNIGLKLNSFRFSIMANAYFSLNKSWSNFTTTNDLLSYGKIDKKQSKVIDDWVNFDFDLGKFIQSPYIEKVQPIINIGFPLMCLNDFYSDIYKPLNAEEITAITLHEIGHLLTLIGNTIYNGYSGITMAMRISNIRKTLKKLKTTDEFYNNISTIASKYVKMNKAKKSKEINKLTDLSNNLDQIKNKDNKVTKLMTEFLLLYLLILLMIRNIINGMYIYSSSKKTNNSREIVTNQNVYMNERWADEFASKLGMAEYLGTGLAKLYQLNDFSDLEQGKNNLYNSYNVQGTVAGIIQSKMFTVFAIYEDTPDRIYRLIQNNRSFLKEANINDKIKDDIIRQNNNLNIIYKKLLSDRNSFLFKLFSSLASGLSHLSVIKWLNDISVNNKYTEVYDQINEFMNNELFESSYKLEKLSKEIGF